MRYPSLEINLDKIRSNASAIVSACAEHNIAVAGVVKGVCGSPKTAKAMLAGGVRQIGDSRIANLEKLRENGINCELILLCIPMLSQARDVVRYANISLNSDLNVIRALGREAVRLERIHKVILMIDTGDLREGVLPGDAPYLAEQIMQMEGIKLEGLGTNLTCYGGVIPTEENMSLLAETAEKIEERTGSMLNIISGGNSSGLPMITAGKMPRKINHVRIGEGILLGQDTVECNPLPGTVQDAFVFKAEVIETGRKPSLPDGKIVRDAFGKKPEFKDRGMHRRAILSAGRQDVNIDGLLPLVPGCEILGASSDHLLIDIEDCREKIAAGDIMSFKVQYSAMLSAVTSEYVNKNFIMKGPREAVKSVSLIKVPVSAGGNSEGPELSPDIIIEAGLRDKISATGYTCELCEGAIIHPLPYRSSMTFTEKFKKTAEVNLVISELVKGKIQKGIFPLILGGDHTVTIGAVSGLKAAGLKNTGLIAFGAFADFNTIETSLTKNLHGLTLKNCADIIEQENIVIAGLRQLDNQERELLKKSETKIFTMEKIDLLGIREVLNQAIEMLSHCSDGIHVSLAMDVLSPEYAPGVSMTLPGGINYREAHLAMEILSNSGLPVSMDIVEINPLRDENHKTVTTAVSLACSLLGKKII